MSIGKIPSEKEFLLLLALHQYNLQYKKRFKPEDCDIFSVEPHYKTQLGYEIRSRILTDFFKIRVYFNFSDRSMVNPYRLEVNKTFQVNQLGDEVYVTTGTIDRYYQDAGIYKFRWIEGDAITDTPFALMNGMAFKLMGGGNLLLVGEEGALNG